MAENPATWGPAEHAVSRALKAYEAARAGGRVGRSQVKAVTDALRAEGLLKEED